MTDSEDALGLAEGWHWVDNGKYAFTGVEQGVFPSNYAYICTRLIPWGGAEAFGYRGDLDHPEWVVQQVMQAVGGQEVTEFVNSHQETQANQAEHKHQDITEYRFHQEKI
jgi:hypothetical protein